MWRLLVRKPQNDDIHYIEAACLSTDTKKTGWATGSICLEVDTGKWYSYDEVSGDWNVIVGGDE